MASNITWVNVGPERRPNEFTFVPEGIDDFFPKIGSTEPVEWPALAQQYDISSVGPPLNAQH